MRKFFLVALLIIFISFTLHGIFYSSSTHYQLPNSTQLYNIQNYESISLEVVTNNTIPVLITINGNSTKLIPCQSLTISNLTGMVTVITPGGQFLLMVNVNASMLLKDAYIVAGGIGSMILSALILNQNSRFLGYLRKL